MNHERDLRTVLTDVSGADAAPLSRDADLVTELGLDSLAGLRLLAAVEKRFDVRFPDEHLSEYRTIRQLLDFIERKPAAGGESS
jgi:acyl carrier protein